MKWKIMKRRRRAEKKESGSDGLYPGGQRTAISQPVAFLRRPPRFNQLSCSSPRDIAALRRLDFAPFAMLSDSPRASSSFSLDYIYSTGIKYLWPKIELTPLLLLYTFRNEMK